MRLFTIQDRKSADELIMMAESVNVYMALSETCNSMFLYSTGKSGGQCKANISHMPGILNMIIHLNQCHMFRRTILNTFGICIKKQDLKNLYSSGSANNATL